MPTWFAVLIVVLAAGPAYSAADEGWFAYRKDVVRAADSTREDILAVELDSDVYEATGKGFADLRVFDAGGKQTPFRLERATEDRVTTVHEAHPVKTHSLKEGADNRIELIVSQEANETLPVDGLRFTTPLRDYERRVSVSGSDDRIEWKPLATDAMLFDYSRYVDLRGGDVALPRNTYRYFKIVIEEVSDDQKSPLTELTRHLRGDEEEKRIERTTVRRRPLRIDRIECYGNVVRTLPRQEKKAEYPVRFDREKDVTQDVKKKQTIVEIGSRREPLTRFTLATPDVNFSRTVSVQVPVERAGATDWVEVGGGTINAIRFRGFERGSLDVSFPEQRQTRYRLVIEDRDAPPLEITGVSAAGNVYRAVFFADGDASYHVLFGSESAEAADYDTTPLDETLARGFAPTTAKLGPQIANPAFGGDEGQRLRRLLRSPWLLGGAIGLMVVVLALILFRAGRRLEALGEE
ncbi:MAG: DUF3999 domain-containing protein [Pirellulaceae bacterium]|nr:DUF3999 domain-containing protein [Pirellulaceae bacterium]